MALRYLKSEISSIHEPLTKVTRVSESAQHARAIHLAHIANLLDTHTSAPQSAEKRLPRTAVSQGCAPTTDYGEP